MLAMRCEGDADASVTVVSVGGPLTMIVPAVAPPAATALIRTGGSVTAADDALSGRCTST
jgi:hypothetical protein